MEILSAKKINHHNKCGSIAKPEDGRGLEQRIFQMDCVF